MEEAVPETGFQKFLKSKYSVPTGLILSLAIGILLFYGGLFAGLCGLGFLLVAVLAFMIPKVFGVTDTKILVVFGVVFFLLITSIGAFVVSPNTISNNSDYKSYDSNGFTNVDFTYTGNQITATVDYTAGKDVVINFGEVGYICYQVYRYASSDNTKHIMTDDDNDGTYTVTFSADSGKLYAYSFIEEIPGAQTSAVKMYSELIDGSQKTMFMITWNAYYAGLTIIMYFMILLFTTYMKKNLEKTREKMEAEGRLYPQGYGRCKECGGVVLPGENCCRKCGAKIEVPEEIKQKLLDSFECSECGAKVPGDAKVCPKCGASFDDDDESA